MQRYFVKIQYKGTDFSGWQAQPNAITVQGEIEKALEKVIRIPTKIVGCGRTDAGVHASDFVFHVDADVEDPDHLVFKVNRILPNSISLLKMVEVEQGHHARFDALQRSYEYHIHRYKNPFLHGLSWFAPHLFEIESDLLSETASTFLMYKDFFPFCKTNTDVKTTLCHVRRSEWEISDSRMIFHVSADRFLRGMVRLMVGACANVAEGKITLREVKRGLEERRRLTKDLSVPADGLFLSKVEY